MKLKLLLLTFILVCTGCKNDSRIQAAYDLIERVTPGYGKQFKLELMEPIDGMDAYEITSDNGKVVLRGNNTISLATAFNQYLKYTCNAHVSWFGNQLDLPKQLPMPAPVKNTINGKYRVYMNYCTVSYSAAWWDWERWQRELDFMAMNSINMPLSVVGLEAVWYNQTSVYGRRGTSVPGRSRTFRMAMDAELAKLWRTTPKILDRQAYRFGKTDYRPGVGIGDATHSTRILRLCSA